MQFDIEKSVFRFVLGIIRKQRRCGLFRAKTCPLPYQKGEDKLILNRGKCSALALECADDFYHVGDKNNCHESNDEEETHHFNAHLHGKTEIFSCNPLN